MAGVFLTLSFFKKTLTDNTVVNIARKTKEYMDEHDISKKDVVNKAAEISKKAGKAVQGKIEKGQEFYKKGEELYENTKDMIGNKKENMK